MELAPGVHAVGQRRGGRVRAFLFERAGELTLVDTMWDGDARHVLDAIRRLGRSPRDLKEIALTHAHRSHLGGLAELKRRSGAILSAHAWEAPIIGGERRAVPVPVLAGPPRILPFRVGLRFGFPKHEPVPIDRTLEDGDSVGPLEVVHIPGHTAGHLGFHDAETRTLVAGDAIATWPRTEAGWPAFQTDEEAHRASLRRLASLEARVVGVGHGEPITAGAPDAVHALSETV